jgi:F-type H+/Na+-transporting ATPase subunit alpha
MDYSVVMLATSEDAPGLHFVTNCPGTRLAEYFIQLGRDVLIIYDGLTKHARAYREVSLLLRRPRGPGAFPGDVFYIHRWVLQRTTHMGHEYGGGSFTALPILETEAENLFAYVPTNIISITDVAYPCCWYHLQ